MRILLLSQFFDPEPVPKGAAFTRELAAAGHQVEVLTGFPNYPGGKLYPGHEVSLHKHERIDGVDVHRVALYPSHDRSALRRIANYASFAVSAATLGPLLVQKPDVVFVYHPPLTVSFPAAVLKLLRGAPFVYEIQDLWPDTLRATGMINRPEALSFIDQWARQVYRVADQIVVISRGFRELLIDRGVPADKIDVLHNWCEEGRVVIQPRDAELMEEHGLSGRFNVMFAGTMGIAQALDAVLDAAAISSEECPRAQYVFVGGGVEKPRLQQRAEHMGLSNVKFLPRQPIENMGRILPLADALLVHLRDDPLFEITIPSKTQAYLYAGLPIIIAMRGDAPAMVERAEAGLTCEPENPRAIADAVKSLANRSTEALETMGRAGREYYDRELSMRIGVRRYLDIFEKVVKRARNQ